MKYISIVLSTSEIYPFLYRADLCVARSKSGGATNSEPESASRPYRTGRRGWFSGRTDCEVEGLGGEHFTGVGQCLFGYGLAAQEPGDLVNPVFPVQGCNVGAGPASADPLFNQEMQLT